MFFMLCLVIMRFVIVFGILEFVVSNVNFMMYFGMLNVLFMIDMVCISMYDMMVIYKIDIINVIGY